ncbi:MAG: ATP-binding protein [Gammaproteobacteria bacterium]|nr:ATP-binding protein [Gammaproteobacteria bacterium]
MSYIYSERESKSLEFKSQIPDFLKLIKTCVAFANGIGGKIIIGVDDKTRSVIGVDDKARNRIYDEFPNSVYDATSPSLLVEIYEKSFEGLSVIIIEVPSSIKKPVFIKGEGMPKGVYLRAGSNTRRANSEYITELMRENQRTYFDEEAVQAGIDILSRDLLQAIFGKVDSPRLVAEKILTPSNTNTKKYYPTIAGVLTFCETPHVYIPEATIICTRFRGIEGRDIIQSEEIQGCLEKQITNSFQLVRSWLIRNYQLTGVKLQGKTIIPEIALREAIANALLHRKYSIPGSVKIALYDDRLEIFSPGNFPGLVDLSNLGDGTTYLRNPHLARIARRFGIIEKLGTGIKLILESCKKSDLKRPEFIESADSVKIIFYFQPEEKNFSLDEDKLLALFTMREEVKLDEVQTYLSVSRNTATRKLNLLIKDKKIKRTGKGPAVRYSKV